MMKPGFVGARGASLLVAALLLTSCADGTSPNLQGAEVRISLGGALYDEQTIALGSTLVLDADVYDATGNPVDGEESFQWSSADAGIASVTPAGVVTGHAIGTTHITVRHDVGEATAVVNVAVPISGPPTCTAGQEQAFQVGVPREFSGSEAATICLPGNAEFSVVIANTGTTAGAVLQTRLTAGGMRAPLGGPSPSLAPSPSAGPVRLSASEAFHQRLRADVSARLEPRLRSGSADILPSGPLLQTSGGQLLSFNVESSSADGCRADNIDLRAGRVRLVTDHAIIVEDTLNPANGYTATDFQEYGDLFDDEIWPLVTSTFGEPSDIDNNGKVIIFFTMAVNQREENVGDQGSYVGGFFFNRDLFSTTGRNGCAGSNEGEMFYMLVPDPDGVVTGPNGDARNFSVDVVKGSTPSVLVHEFQHLVNDSRRLHITKALVWEETWLNEGLSHIAEELMFFDQADLQPRQNLDAFDFLSASTRYEFERFMLHNLERLGLMLVRPARSSFMGSDLLETRGAAWLFLRYLADRRGGDERAFWTTLVKDADISGLANIERALGEDPRPWVADWAAALYLDDSGVNAPPEYQISSWDFRSLYPSANDLWPGTFYAQYPLKVYTLLTAGAQTACRYGQSQQNCDFSLKGGSPAYMRAGTGSDGNSGVRVTAGGLPAPSRLRVVVTRLE